MKLMKCINNHYYDGDVYSQCPHCKNVSDYLPTEKITSPAKNPLIDMDLIANGDFWDKPVVNGKGEDDLEKVIDDLNKTEILSPKSGGKCNDDNGRGEKNDTPPHHVIPNDECKTVSFSSRKEDAKEPLVGWLVGLNGEVYGEGFPLVTGRNYIGRGADMDVVLRGDPSVSRNKHSIIIYEPKSRQFLIQPGESKELFYMDDKVVVDTQVMSNGCELCIGETKLKFVAFCGEDFSWETNS